MEQAHGLPTKADAQLLPEYLAPPQPPSTEPFAGTVTAEGSDSNERRSHILLPEPFASDPARPASRSSTPYQPPPTVSSPFESQFET